MSDRLVLVDSSGWVGHLAGRRSPVEAAVGRLLEDRRAAANAIVRLEILTGARDEAQYAELADAFQGLPDRPLSGEVWRCAERLRFDLRRKGQGIPVPDVLIAGCALVHDCELLHADRHFDVIARLAPLRIHAPRA